MGQSFLDLSVDWFSDGWFVSKMHRNYRMDFIKAWWEEGEWAMVDLIKSFFYHIGTFPPTFL